MTNVRDSGLSTLGCGIRVEWYCCVLRAETWKMVGSGRPLIKNSFAYRRQNCPHRWKWLKISLQFSLCIVKWRLSQLFKRDTIYNLFTKLQICMCSKLKISLKFSLWIVNWWFCQLFKRNDIYNLFLNCNFVCLTLGLCIWGCNSLIPTNSFLFLDRN